MTQPQSQFQMTDANRRRVSIWLSLCLLLVAAMVVLGGVTRLTESGLSIVEWKLISGAIPPQGEEAWQAEFEQYKNSPQFEKMFPGMTVEEFKNIYWLEYLHRLLGRVIGALFLLPLAFFAFTRAIGIKKTLQLTGIFALGGLQGIFGWLMVQSGLIDEPRVSPYMLALHLSTCFMLFGLILWQILSISNPEASDRFIELPRPKLALKLFACLVLMLLLTQITYGAFVAGLRAGLAYNTFPLMEGKWIPEGFWMHEEWWANLFEDVSSVQFLHRMMAYILAATIPLLWLAGRRNPHVAHLLPILFSVFVIQFLLGVLTLLFVVPIPLASLHQANALLLFGVAVAIVHRLWIPRRILRYDMLAKQAIA